MNPARIVFIVETWYFDTKGNYTKLQLLNGKTVEIMSRNYKKWIFNKLHLLIDVFIIYLTCHLHLQYSFLSWPCLSLSKNHSMHLINLASVHQSLCLFINKGAGIPFVKQKRCYQAPDFWLPQINTALYLRYPCCKSLDQMKTENRTKYIVGFVYFSYSLKYTLKMIDILGFFTLEAKCKTDIEIYCLKCFLQEIA